MSTESTDKCDEVGDVINDLRSTEHKTKQRGMRRLRKIKEELHSEKWQNYNK